jgi:hypothetical protein
MNKILLKLGPVLGSASIWKLPRKSFGRCGGGTGDPLVIEGPQHRAGSGLDKPEAYTYYIFVLISPQ